jgi:hypothetical protein
MRVLFGLGLLPLALLAGCQSNEQILAEARTRGLEVCNNSPQVKQAPPGFDTGRFCTCLVDKTLAGKSVSDIENMKEAEQTALGARAGAECSAEQMPATPAAAPAAAAPAGQPAVNEAAQETVEETVDEAE